MPQTFNWDSINPELLQQNNQQEISKLYSVLKPFFLNFFKHDEELYNDFVLKLLTELHTFKAQAKFSTWAFAIAKNLHLNHLDKKETEKKREKLIHQAFFYMQEQHFSIQNKEELESLIGELKPKQQEFIEKYLENKPLYTKQRHKYSYAIKRMKAIRTDHLPH